MFTDESHFLLRPVGGRIHIWRRRNEVLRQDLVVETTAFGGGSVMVWGTICCNGRSPLVVLRRTLNGEGYRRVLSDHLLPWAVQFLRPPQLAGLLQEDNATPHCCQIVRRFQEHLVSEGSIYQQGAQISIPSSTCGMNWNEE